MRYRDLLLTLKGKKGWLSGGGFGSVKHFV